jgi:E3 ubiquitin-protein ligase SIAH1
VESFRVPCPNAAHGCAARLTYYDRSSHRTVCPHARYSCSGHGCGFVGSLGALLDRAGSMFSKALGQT